MKLTKATFLLALTTILVLAACGGRAQATNGADLQISLVAPSEGANAQYLIVQVADKAGKPITNAMVNVEGNMQHAGMAPVMGKAASDEADGKADGRYQIPFAFDMLGDWIITVSVKNADNTTVQRDIPVTVSEQGVKVK